MGDISTITIEELSGSERIVELHGGGLPHKPTEWGGKQTIKTTWYPGNPRASQQVLGSQEVPSHWTGEWSRVKLSRTPVILHDDGGQHSIARPEQIMEFIEDIRRSGALLRVTWTTSADGIDYNLVREGRLEDTKWTFKTIHDLGWELTFTWVGLSGTDSARLAVSTRDDKTSDTVSLNAALNDMVAVLIAEGIAQGSASRPQSASFFSIGQLEAFAKGPFDLLTYFARKAQQIVSNVTQIGDVIASIGNEPFAISNLFVEFAHSTVIQTNATYDKLTSTPPDLLSTNYRVSDVTRACKAFGQSVEAQERISATAKALEFKARVALSHNPGGATPTQQPGSPLHGTGMLAIYEAKQGDTPITVSVQFYQSPDYAVNIMKANHLPWTTVSFDRGKVLVIPELPAKQNV